MYFRVGSQFFRNYICEGIDITEGIAIPQSTAMYLGFISFGLGAFSLKSQGNNVGGWKTIPFEFLFGDISMRYSFF